MARASQTQRNYAIEEAKKAVIAAIANIQFKDRNQRLADEKANKPTMGDLQNALRNGQITLPAGVDLTTPAHTNFRGNDEPIGAWILANSKKAQPETTVSYYGSVKSFCSTSSSWRDVESGFYASSDDTYYQKQENLNKVKKLMAEFDFTKRAIMLGDAAEMNLALSEFTKRIADIV